MGQSLLADVGRGDLLKTIIDRVELRPNGLRMILSLVRLTLAAAPPNRLQGCVLTREFPLRIKRRGVEMRFAIDAPDPRATNPDPVLLKEVKRARRIDALLMPDPTFAATPLAWLRNAPTAPKPDHVRALLDRLRRVREIGVPPEAAGRIHEDRFQQPIREAQISDAHQMGRYTVQRRRAILVASVIDLETRLTDAALLFQSSPS